VLEGKGAEKFTEKVIESRNSPDLLTRKLDGVIELNCRSS
jgi:hypothetical protein